MESGSLSRVVIGRVMHRRRLPVENRFVYPVFFLLIDLDGLARHGSWLFGINRWRPLAFHYKDYGDGRDPRLWVGERLAEAGIHDCNGGLWLQTFPRVFGYLFNPVSFWYCQRVDGRIGAVVAEVNNTFGERHCYVLQPRADGSFAGIEAEKRLYVSPFYPVSGGYRFHIRTDSHAPRVQIDYYDKGELQLHTAIWGISEPLNNRTLLTALLKQPMLTLGVMLRIHWQALRLWSKGVSLTTRSSSMEETAK
ncbi:MAG: DUF1365 domain-containing protein [Candidatus Thiodiazotropha sp.]|nr:DUF1365 domain-containing protein [Candidatus Thiodiazotropha sp. (ex Lucina pensylvanica)]MBT3063634.1 DUF1365 domain-containing protein [Candidatus Thiodiazotropha sp. (ex Lucina pensylvanica)]MBV2096955.1 DUF1365 domain-containing protein [Candidatus Thiodiazotropha sp. (ex Codakia orbicularis)]